MIMDALNINFGFLLAQIIIPITLIVLPLLSLVDLARKKLGGTPLALWVLIICAIPLLGPLAYWIVKPTSESRA
jgi:hypothetical protein